eukprot:4210071-Prymnesium_polylepis.1
MRQRDGVAAGRAIAGLSFEKEKLAATCAWVDEEGGRGRRWAAEEVAAREGAVGRARVELGDETAARLRREEMEARERIAEAARAESAVAARGESTAAARREGVA